MFWLQILLFLFFSSPSLFYFEGSLLVLLASLSLLPVLGLSHPNHEHTMSMFSMKCVTVAVSHSGLQPLQDTTDYAVCILCAPGTEHNKVRRASLRKMSSCVIHCPPPQPTAHQPVVAALLEKRPAHNAFWPSPLDHKVRSEGCICWLHLSAAFVGLFEFGAALSRQM